ncbi:phasin family protein [Oxalobacteraceae bacterium]|nr:phasin family protein [Oxalobacteraceae bacterium]
MLPLPHTPLSLSKAVLLPHLKLWRGVAATYRQSARQIAALNLGMLREAATESGQAVKGLLLERDIGGLVNLSSDYAKADSDKLRSYQAELAGIVHDASEKVLEQTREFAAASVTGARRALPPSGENSPSGDGLADDERKNGTPLVPGTPDYASNTEHSEPGPDDGETPLDEHTNEPAYDPEQLRRIAAD